MTQESNFGEGHFQTLCLGEISRYASRLLGRISIPMIPTQPEEELLGFDAGFFFPWLSHSPIPGKYSANLFVQFKVADVEDGEKTSFWSEWSKQEHFRYRLYYYRRESPSDSKSKKDYGQLEALRQLAAKKYPVFYISNETTDITQVNLSAEQGRLLWDSRWVDVRHFDKIYNYVSYRISEGTKLHGSLREIPRTEVTSVDSLMKISRGDFAFSNILEDVARLIMAAEERMQGGNRPFTTIWQDERLRQFERSDLRYFFRYRLAAHYLRRYLNTFWILLDQ